MAETCANCGAPLAGRYCVQCGQDSHEHRLPIHALASEAADQFLSIDGRILRTLYLLLFVPGELTRAYIAGKRQPYVPALRLYLFITVGFFIALSALGIALLQLVPYDPKTEPPASYIAVSNETAGTVAARVILFSPFVHKSLTEVQRASLRKMQANLESQTVASAAIGDRFVHVMARAYADGAAFNADVQTLISRYFLAMMPLFALMTAAVRPGRRFLLIDHLTFALHFHSFLFLLLFGTVALATVVPGRVVLWLTLVVLALYLFQSLRRAYGLALFGAVWRSIALLGVYCAVVVYGVQTLIWLTLGS